MPKTLKSFHENHKSAHTISMKKLQHQPDFSKLCKPAQNHILDIASLLIFFFFVASITGFLWEVLIFLVKEGRFRNRGFLYGPWLPVYGIGAVLFFVLLCKKKSHPLTVFLLSLFIGTGLELVIGWFLDTWWGLRYWDYTTYFLNFHGYICLFSAAGFGIAGTIWICLLSTPLKKLWFLLPVRLRRALNTILILLFVTDCAAALIFPNTGKGVTF